MKLKNIHYKEIRVGSDVVEKDATFEADGFAASDLIARGLAEEVEPKNKEKSKEVKK
jgi:hypothetical protein